MLFSRRRLLVLTPLGFPLLAITVELTKVGLAFLRQQLLFPQQLMKRDPTATSDGVGDGGLDDEANRFGAPLNGRSISTNSRSVVFSRHRSKW